MHPFIKVIFFATFLSTLSACTSFFSGDEPVPITFEERKQVEHAGLYLQVPNWRINPNNKKIIYYVVAFDGTDNDKDDITDGSTQTIVAHLFDLLHGVNGYDGKYYSGPGTHGGIINSRFDAAKCFSCVETAERALNELSKYLDNAVQQSQDLELRVLTLGFSRGAAIARHFMNQVSNKFQTSLVVDQKNPGGVLVRTSGILYDTVATGVIEQLDLGISPSTDFLLHFIANDETRRLFPVVRDFDVDFFPLPGDVSFLSFHTCKPPRISTSNRMVQMALPGAHSDIGASYESGLGAYYRLYGEIALLKMGLIEKDRYQLKPNIFTAGKHDSRGLYDYIAEYLFGERKRDVTTTKSVPLKKEEYELVKTRLEKLHSHEIGYFRGSTDIGPLVFDLYKDGEKLVVDKAYDEISKTEFGHINEKPAIFYSFPQSTESAWLPLSEKVWNAIPDGKKSRLEFISLRRNGIKRGYFFVNCKAVEMRE
ncbi:DUF2235 domain-containing protein [Salinimonas iocasae]|uniref:Uncharacterized protein n=1 Tax=Salinimonas iocasae TaxID=2572577 RepID=A0A5B7YFD9_9ALTE|nr:DUF2235 domain-containing protein [Salinimonas iocasae]QCZ94417.1 hypothetical protein FBQ74_13495 [Salinimonas iocasae]